MQFIAYLIIVLGGYGFVDLIIKFSKFIKRLKQNTQRKEDEYNEEYQEIS